MKKQVDCIFYLVDSYLYLYNLKKEEIKKYKFSNYIYYGRIVKVSQFLKKLNEIIKQEKISKLFTGLKAIVIYEPYLQYNDKKIIIDAFDQCGFKDLKLISTKQILSKNKTFIEINEKYLILYNENEYCEYKKPSRDAVLKFKCIVEASGKKVTVRLERGADIDAACGQLSSKYKK